MEDQTSLRQLLDACREKLGLSLLLETVAVAANEATALEDAVRTSLGAVCSLTGWCAGHAYRVASDHQLVSMEVWHLEEGERYQVLQKAATAWPALRDGWMAAGSCPGACPEWARGRLRTSRGELPEELGIVSAYRFPVFADHRLVAILEFFSRSNDAPGKAFLDAMERVGNQLGHVFRRHERESQLAARQRLYESFARVSPIGMSRADAEGNTIDLNPRGSEILGLSHEEVMGNGWVRSLHPDDLERVATAWQSAVRECKPFESEYRFLHRSTNAAGKSETRVRWVLGQAVPEIDDDGRLLGFVGTVTDVTESREAALALQASQKMLQLVMDNIPQHIFWKDLDSVYIGCNQNFAKDAGLERPEDIVGKTDFDLPWRREESEFFRMVDRRVMDNDQPEYRILEPLLKADGKEAWLETNKIPLHDSSGRVVGILGTYEDISERKAAEERLRESQAQLRQVIDLVPHFIFAKDAEGRFLLVNKAVADAYGTTVEDLMGRSELEFAPNVEDARRYHEDDLKVIESGQPLIIPEETVTDRNGNVHLLQTLKIPFRTSGSDTPAILGVAIDITDRRRAEETGRRLEAQVREIQKQKLESIGVLAGGIAHDFNNILVGILGYSELALMGLPAGSPARGRIEKISHAAERAAALIEQLLAYSGHGTLMSERLDLSRMVEDISGLLQMSISKKVVLTRDFHPEPLYVETDPAQMQQVIMNLIMNASDAAQGKSGTIHLRSGVLNLERAYFSRPSVHARADLQEGEYAFLEVIDNGCGMDETTRARMFDPFFTTKVTGHGLGLAAVLGIVQGHFGAIEVESEVGRGTTLRVLLPRVEAGSTAVVEAACPGPAPSVTLATTGSTVLVVDDEKVVRELAADALTAVGLRTLLAADGAEALEIFRHDGDDIAAVLLDLSMPVMSGEETLRELLRLRPGVRVMLSSGYKEKTVAERLGLECEVDFIQKPYSPQALSEAICRLFV